MKRMIQKTMIALMLAFGFTYSVQAQSSEKVELKGYCPVAYHAMNKAVKGNPDYSSTYKGKAYHFVKADARKMFDAHPEMFLPKYDGYCATAMSMGKKIESDPTLFSVYKDATYLFSGKDAKAKFDQNPDMFIKKANQAFAKL